MTKKQRVPRSVKDSLREQAVKGRIRPPDLAKLVSHFFEVAGGERAVAKMLYEEMAAAPAGGIVRQRILDLILRSTKYAGEKMAPQDDLGVLSEEDLERELDQLIEVFEEEEGGSDAAGQSAQHGHPQPQAQGPEPAAPGPSPAPARAPGPAPGSP